MDKNQRSIILIVFVVPVVSLLYAFTHNSLGLDSSLIAVIFTSLIMLAFTSLFLEHYFTRPADVLSSAIAILLMMAPLKNALGALGYWYWAFVAYVFIQASAALLSLILVDNKKSTQSIQNIWAHRLNRFCIHFGNGRLLFFGLFFLMLIFFISEQTKTQFLFLAIF
ncbi:MAG: hypothetical protein JJ964_05555, partial [Rhizobiales bacterium]|nr:hypothetical protein [Hyphomicrobiales bacterium]